MKRLKETGNVAGKEAFKRSCCGDSLRTLVEELNAEFDQAWEWEARPKDQTMNVA